MFRGSIVIVFLLTAAVVSAQTDTADSFNDALIDLEPDNADLDPNAESTTELLIELLDQLILRSSTRSMSSDELFKSIPLLTDYDLARLLNDTAMYRQEPRFRFYRTLLDRRSRSSVVKGSLIDLRSRVYFQPTLDDDPEYTLGKYRGSTQKIYNRLYASTGNLQFGVLQAKDYGEPIFFDHLSAHLALTEPFLVDSSTGIRSIIAGDYTISFGQGLMLNSGLAPYKSRDVITPVIPQRSGALPYLSSSAYRYFRGGSVTLGSNTLTLTPFYSIRYADASVTDSNTVSSLSYTGYHRTTTELNRRQAVEERSYGAISQASLMVGSVQLIGGLGACSLVYDKTVVSSDTLRTRFHGTDISMVSASLSASGERFIISAEASQSSSTDLRSMAAVGSAVLRPFNKTEFALQFRSIPEEFLSPRGSVFGDNSDDANNETGGYFGIRQRIADRITAEGYADFSLRIDDAGGLRYDLNTSDYRITLRYGSADLFITSESRLRSRGELVRNDDRSYSPATAQYIRQLVNVDHQFDPILLRIRTGVTSYKRNERNETGLGASLMIRTQPIEILRIELGGSYYDTPSYESRLYFYESDLRGVFTLNALYGKGGRAYLLTSASIGDMFDLGIKTTFAQYRYKGELTLRRYAGIQAELRI